MIQQVLATGVHGILLCHTRAPEAARVLVEATRYPFAPKAAGLGEGLRGSGGQGFASQVWGIPAEYLKKADVWPLNPDGEILSACKAAKIAFLGSGGQAAADKGRKFSKREMPW